MFFSHISVRFLWPNDDSRQPGSQPLPAQPRSALSCTFLCIHSYMKWILLLLLLLLLIFILFFASGFVELKNWCENSKGVASACAGCCEITSCVKLCELRTERSREQKERHKSERRTSKIKMKSDQKGARIFMHVVPAKGARLAGWLGGGVVRLCGEQVCCLASHFYCISTLAYARM